MAKKNKNSNKTDKPATKPDENAPSDGDTLQVTLNNGANFEAVAKDGKFACPVCERPVPKGKTLTEERKKRLEERATQLEDRLVSDFQRTLDLMKTNAARAGEEAPSVEEMIEALKKQAAEG